MNDSSLPWSTSSRRRQGRGTRPRAGAGSPRSEGRGPSPPRRPGAPACPLHRRRGRTSRRSPAHARVRPRWRRRSPRCARTPCAPARTGIPPTVRPRDPAARVTIAIVRRRHDHEHVAEVLRSRANEARPADVDFLNKGVERGGGIRSGAHERIQVHDDDVDRLDAVAGDGVEVVGARPAGEDPAVDRRVQRLHAPVQHLGKPGNLRDSHDSKPAPAQRRGRAAGRDQLESASGQRPGEFRQPRLVRHAQQCSGHRCSSCWIYWTQLVCLTLI